MFLTPLPTSNNKYYSTLLFCAVIFSLCCQCCYARMHRSSLNLNPNTPCLPKNVEYKWRPCKSGGYVADNPYPQNCSDRYICYKGLNEQCNHEEKCADNAICTACGICQKCDSADNCSEFELCPNYAPYGYQTMHFIKRFLQKRFGKIGSQ